MEYRKDAYYSLLKALSCGIATRIFILIIDLLAAERFGGLKVFPGRKNASWSRRG
jgi:hypothetical protein